MPYSIPVLPVILIFSLCNRTNIYALVCNEPTGLTWWHVLSGSCSLRHYLLVCLWIPFLLLTATKCPVCTCSLPSSFIPLLQYKLLLYLFSLCSTHPNTFFVSAWHMLWGYSCCLALGHGAVNAEASISHNCIPRW